MTDSSWQAANIQAITERLKGIAGLPDGIIHRIPDSPHELVVKKSGTNLALHFHPDLQSEIQARMDINDPLKLLAPFTQMLMLSLLLVAEPQRIYIIGFGGGRVPMIFHHYFEKLIIDCADTDKDVAGVAAKYFGMVADERLRLVIHDGRRFLEERKAPGRYDIIIVDAFDGIGNGPYELATREFYALCRKHLSENGVVAVNMLGGDSLRERKMFTIRESFANTYSIRDTERGNFVLFGCTGNVLAKEELIRRANSAYEKHRFHFPFSEHANNLKLLPGTIPFLQEMVKGTALTDRK